MLRSVTIDTLTKSAVKLLTQMQLCLLSLTEAANVDKDDILFEVYKTFDDYPAICLPPMKRQIAVDKDYKKTSAYNNWEEVEQINPTGLPLYISGRQGLPYAVAQRAIDLLTETSKDMGYNGIYEFESRPLNKVNLTAWLQLVDAAIKLGKRKEIVDYETRSVEVPGKIKAFSEKVIIYEVTRGIYRGFFAVLDAQNGRTLETSKTLEEVRIKYTDLTDFDECLNQK